MSGRRKAGCMWLPVIDLFSRRVAGWSMSAAMTAKLVTDALVTAIWRRGKPDALLHHSDRGSQYTGERFQRLMADYGVACASIGSGGLPSWDRAMSRKYFCRLSWPTCLNSSAKKSAFSSARSAAPARR
jgi:transposase InsO family protein